MGSPAVVFKTDPHTLALKLREDHGMQLILEHKLQWNTTALYNHVNVSHEMLST